MFNIILGIILCLIFMSYNQEIVQFLIHSGSIDSVISYLESLKLVAGDVVMLAVFLFYFNALRLLL